MLSLPTRDLSPWWKDIADVVALARATHDVEITVLRLLATELPAPPGGDVTYLVQYDGPAPEGLVPVVDRPDWTTPDQLRMPWAAPGGPAAALAWAEQALAEQGRTVTGRQQQRCWNLSSIWRLDTDLDPVWLKEVPPFFAHEPAVLRWLARPNTPVVLAAADRRMLLADVPGTDRYDADAAERAGMLAALLDIQTATTDRLPELLALGVPDMRAQPFRRNAEALLEQEADGLDPADRAVLADLVDGLPKRFAALADCGIPDTLVHGDFHPGNVRSDGGAPVIIDWTDSIVAHPVLDMVRMRDWIAGADQAPELTALWCDHWRRSVPGCDPERTVELIAPLTGLREAFAYVAFIRSIEPSEHPFHSADVLAGIRSAIDRHRTSWHG
jgi:Phosphotransferase enzyme family